MVVFTASTHAPSADTAQSNEIRLNQGIAFRSESFGGIIYDRVPLDYVPINRLGFDVLRTAAITPALTAVIDRLVRRYPSQSREVIDADVRAFLAQLVDRRLIRPIDLGTTATDMPTPADGLPPYPIMPGTVDLSSATALRSLKAPLIAQLAVIFTCNLTCVHCYTSSTAEQRPDTLTFDEIVGVIDDAAANEVFDLSLTGGEALLRKDIFEIIEYAKQYPLFVNLNSNGTPVTPRVAQQLYAAGLDQVRVSIDSATADVHDAFRGRTGAFKATLRGIDRLLAAGLRTEIHATLSAEAGDQQSDVDALIQLARDIGVARISFGAVNSVGRADDDPDRLKVEQHRLAELVDHIEQLARQDPFVGGAPHARQPRFPGIPGYDGCGNCLDSPLSYINYNGMMYPCPAMYKPQWALGSVRQQGFTQIWRDSPTLARLRDAAGTRYE